ncbi:RpiB/LacA/LacB family sugar-phosphate isomerase [Actinomyces urogenitalis]|uniref:RpiB/LacA/LacB family sugar-phosphate isomerase n=1 Tax=Actinomyces urogenitalis TaxID=103621 RepID=UPI00050EE873|nr:RpiB/LacA/LacB family sugar-phosphate isomerase [Actinomyces urogenitalis]KGF03989.1 sugar phosphate isomerase [Actinomyces urogenitalis S6-C4]MDK8237959.1 RpiB/LacA/LacB family sugar-phosphate isomerase [Actinomyces urogenitalis]MDU5427170.1 RpiB/LacA/LacB family sugar-phosphate isomerase [Actinomyces urogenitalis]MDU5874259.1 RpiB/LacA/LacB family sugar-phosphate isomerase [Actinomyces urogenitalis]WOO95368.1 RpiB/LacA/LacB family sugar-phosphate isomerase [Actinomyces urogenitalis]
MKLAFGCDPNATELKAVLIEEATKLGHEVVDYPSEDPIYANVAIAVATDVAAGKADRGILVCGTGIGVSIAANKVPGAYCACVADVYQAQRASLSNNANLISMGSQVVGPESAKVFLREYLAGQFDPNGRSGPKVERICEFERSQA